MAQPTPLFLLTRIPTKKRPTNFGHANNWVCGEKCPDAWPIKKKREKQKHVKGAGQIQFV